MILGDGSNGATLCLPTLEERVSNCCFLAQNGERGYWTVMVMGRMGLLDRAGLCWIELELFLPSTALGVRGTSRTMSNDLGSRGSFF